MTETRADPAHAYPALYLLRTQLERRGYTCRLDENALTVVAPVDHGPRLADEVTCRTRPDVDDTRLWFRTSWGRWLSPIDSVEDAALQIVTLLKPSGGLVSGPGGAASV